MAAITADPVRLFPTWKSMRPDTMLDAVLKGWVTCSAVMRRRITCERHALTEDPGRNLGCTCQKKDCDKTVSNDEMYCAFHAIGMSVCRCCGASLNLPKRNNNKSRSREPEVDKNGIRRL